MAIAAREQEKSGHIAERDLGTADEERIAEIDKEIGELKTKMTELEAAWKSETELVKEIRSLREILSESKDDPAAKREELRAKANRFEPAFGPATLSGVAVETDDKTGLATRIAPVRIGGRLSQTVPDFW